MDQYTNRGNKATRFGFGEGLLASGKSNSNVVALGADITSSVAVNLFAEAFKDRFISLGIAEQNAMGIAAGLALSGKLPVFSTYGVFAAMRTTDFIRISVCYNNVHVVIGGAHAGISVGPDGATHQALEDIAMMRSLPNMTVISPADYTQTYKATRAAIDDLSGPVYIRFGREAVPDFTSLSSRFTTGKADLLLKGDDVAIIATGHMVWEALEAAKELAKQGISASVMNLHTIKPIDKQAIIDIARHTGAVVTAEEHQQTGGMGSAVCETLCQNYPVPLEMTGMPDTFGESGKPEELMKKYNLTWQGIVNNVHSVLKRKKQ